MPKDPVKQLGERLQLDPEILKNRFIELIRAEIFIGIMDTAYSPAAKARLLKGFEVVATEDDIVIEARDPAFKALIKGQKAGQMRWLTKADRPIPIVLDDGTVIFRNATARSMANGSWMHPGRKDTGVVEVAKARAKELIRDLIMKRKR